MADVIHKLNITAEAAFDISEALELAHFDKRALKTEVEEYIGYLTASGRMPWWGYFRCDYDDDESGRRLKLFVYKGAYIGLMQYWDLMGVCFAEDWTQEAEDDGIIRAWLHTKIEEIAEEEDAAVRLRVHEVLKNTQKTIWENVLQEVKNDFECERDKETAEKLALLQSVFFDFRGRKRVKTKARRDRKARRET